MALKDNDISTTLAGIDPKFVKLLQALMEGGELERRATERDVVMDPMQRMGQFRNQPYAPRASGGAKHIFTGGSPFPMSQGQQRAEKTLAGGMFAGNMMDSLNSVVPSIVDAWRKRKGQQGGQS